MEFIWLYFVMSPLCQAFVYGLLYNIKLQRFISKSTYVNHNCLDNEISYAVYDDDVPSVCFLTEDCGLGHNILVHKV